MTQLTKQLMCICLRNNVEIWLEGDRATKLMETLESSNAPQFIRYEQRLINKADLVGIFTSQDMEENTRRKNGQWKCKNNNWHEKGIKCECLDNKTLQEHLHKKERWEKCGKCNRGFIVENNTAKVCECQT